MIRTSSTRSWKLLEQFPRVRATLQAASKRLWKTAISGARVGRGNKAFSPWANYATSDVLTTNHRFRG